MKILVLFRQVNLVLRPTVLIVLVGMDNRSPYGDVCVWRVPGDDEGLLSTSERAEAASLDEASECLEKERDRCVWVGDRARFAAPAVIVVVGVVVVVVIVLTGYTD